MVGRLTAAFLVFGFGLSPSAQALSWWDTCVGLLQGPPQSPREFLQGEFTLNTTLARQLSEELQAELRKIPQRVRAGGITRADVQLLQQGPVQSPSLVYRTEHFRVPHVQFPLVTPKPFAMDPMPSDIRIDSNRLTATLRQPDVQFWKQEWDLFEPEADGLPGIEEERKRVFLSAYEENLHVLQVLRETAGLDYTVSRAMQLEPVKRQVRAISATQRRQTPDYLGYPWEADAYAVLIEDFGVDWVPSYLGQRYAERAAIDAFYRN